MAAPQLSYFTCTLSEALEHNRRLGARVESSADGSTASNDLYEDVNGFVDFLATEYGNRLAVGCVKPALSRTTKAGHSELQEELLTFDDVRKLSIQVGRHLEQEIRADRSQSDWVALLATSSPVFLLVWLGLLRVGLKVLLIAPQSSTQTVQHLLRLSGASTILHDHQHQEIVNAAIQYDEPSSTAPVCNDKDSSAVQCVRFPWSSIDDVAKSTADAGERSNATDAHGKATDVVYSFHSSGTTGLPKLIPQTNHGAVGVLPLLQAINTQEELVRGSFTTTPLYSGGVADVFRSWSAAAPLWLFPEGHMPITASSILSCINGVDGICQRSNTFPNTRLCYLSCVPFVLESMMEHADSLRRLQELEMVGVGGAAMPKHLGDTLVENNVNLVSRFGSSENGFLLSSARDFKHDQQWDVLRSQCKDLHFQKLDGYDDRFELIVSATWPLVSLATHAKRPFNTHDVFVPHPDNHGSWYYKGRSDAQLTLKTGRKFDPTEYETALKVCDFIADAVVVGDGQVVPAAFIFASEQGDKLDKEELVQNVKVAVSNANQNASKYARLEWQYIQLLKSSDISRIPKNNKGGVVRSTFSTEFASDIASLYGEVEDQGTSTEKVDISSQESILVGVRMVVVQQLGKDCEIGDDDELFEAGLDSQGCMAICQQLRASTGIKNLNLGTIYECGTIRHLAEHIFEALGPSAEKNQDQRTNAGKIEEMNALVQEYVELQPKLLQSITPSGLHPKLSTASSDEKVFLLTGATGFLGIHILQLLLQNNAVTRIFVLIRGSRSSSHQEQCKTAKARVEAALSFHHLNTADASSAFAAKVTFVPFFLKDDGMGIPESIRTEIITSITHIIHAAWEVNFNLPLKAFAAHIKGTVNLFNMAILAGQQGQRTVSFTFCSSIASIQNSVTSSSADVQHNVSRNPDDAAQLGYGQSKWVTEKVLDTLSQQNTTTRLSLLRVGQLSSDTIHGIWNRREAWPLMIDASLQIVPQAYENASFQNASSPQRCHLPDIASTRSGLVDWLPVNIAAEVVVQSTIEASQSKVACQVRPVINADRQISWSTAQQYIEQWASKNNYTFHLVPAQEWLDRLESTKLDHQAKALLPLWRKNWIQTSSSEGRDGREETSDRDKSSGKSGAENDFALDDKYFDRLLTWIARGDKS